MSARLELKARFGHIFTHLNDGAPLAAQRIREECRQTILNSMSRRNPLPAAELTAFTTFPEIAFLLGPELLMAEDVLEQLKPFSGVLYHILISDYDGAAESLEPYVIGEGEGENLYRLMTWSRRSGRPLRQPLEYYEDWLARDPYWAGLYLASEPSGRLAAATAAYSERYHLEDAGAAYAHLCRNADADHSAYQRILCRNPFYLLLAILRWPGKYTTRLLLREGLSPRWAYHLALTHGASDAALLEEVMESDIGWLIEFYVDSGLAADRTCARRMAQSFRSSSGKYDHCCKEAGVHFINRLTAFFKAQQSATVPS